MNYYHIITLIDPVEVVQPASSCCIVDGVNKHIVLSVDHGTRKTFKDVKEQTKDLLKHFGYEGKPFECLKALEDSTFFTEEEIKAITKDYTLYATSYISTNKKGIGCVGKVYNQIVKVLNIIEVKEDSKVKDWYLRTYPSDDMGESISKEITFEDVYLTLSTGKGHNIYEVLKAHDSFIRERVFQQLAKIKKVDYKIIYDLWLQL